jgi:hypothetical protein
MLDQGLLVDLPLELWVLEGQLVPLSFLLVLLVGLVVQDYLKLMPLLDLLL